MRPTEIPTVVQRSRSLVSTSFDTLVWYLNGLNAVGIGVYFISPLFSIPIAVTLTLDGQPPEVVDLQTKTVLNIYESEASAARWGVTGLDNVPHSLVITYAKPLNNTRSPAPYTIVDGFM